MPGSGKENWLDICRHGSRRAKEVKVMRTYERPTLRPAGSFVKKTGIGQHGPNDLIVLFGKQ